VDVEILHEAQAELGEGPAWDARTGALYWVDILKKRLHIYREGQRDHLQLEHTPGCVAPCSDRSLVLALSAPGGRQSFTRLDIAAASTTVLGTITETANNRFNDGKCDPRGRFLAGTMDMNEKEASGALYAFDGTRVATLLTGIRISNGLAWSPDFKTFYYIDTPTRQVRAFDYVLDSGQLHDPRVVLTVPQALGWPDGMTSDTQGNLWIAMWGGAQVTRWDPRTGQLVGQIPLPARQVTSCVFGGDDLDELYITSARTGLSAADLTAFRYSGSLMRLKTGFTGMPTFEFGYNQSHGHG